MPFLARGMATLVFEGPGQGEAQYDFPIRGDYEVPVKAVLDYVETRNDLDTARIGMWGVSLGGYYAPRAAAFEKRIKACIALGGPFNMGAAFDSLPDLTRETFRIRSHAKTREEAHRNAKTLSLEGIARNGSPARSSSSTAGTTASFRRPTPNAWRARSRARSR